MGHRRLAHRWGTTDRGFSFESYSGVACLGCPNLRDNLGHPIREPIWALYFRANLGFPIWEPISDAHNLGTNLGCPHQGDNLGRPIWEPILGFPSGSQSQTHLGANLGYPHLGDNLGPPSGSQSWVSHLGANLRRTPSWCTSDWLPDGLPQMGSQIEQPRLDLRWSTPNRLHDGVPHIGHPRLVPRTEHHKLASRWGTQSGTPKLGADMVHRF